MGMAFVLHTDDTGSHMYAIFNSYDASRLPGISSECRAKDNSSTEGCASP